MLHIRTLGAADIAIGDAHLSADQPIAFALLFVLAMRPGATVARRQLAELLWPDAADAKRNHRLRSLLHRVRRLGAPLLCSSTSVTLERHTADFREYITLPTSTADIRRKLPCLGPVLPQLAALPPALADRLEPERDVIVATTTRWLLAAIALAKAAADWPLLEEAARRARDVDPNNETAAQSLADAERLTAESTTGDIPLVGREDIMQRIRSACARAADGHGAALLLWGPAGIGKTRLLEDSARQLSKRSRVIATAARPVHALRPLALIIDLARRLLDEPGAAGCEPGAYQSLRQWTELRSPNDSAAAPAGEAELFDAMVELLSALSDESPLMLVIDDMHLVDQSAWRFLRAVFRWSADRRIVWVLAYRALREAELAALPEETVIRRIAVRALASDASLKLVEAVGLRSRAIVEQILNTAGGHPLLLREAARHNGIVPASAKCAVDDTIARLPREALHVLLLLASVGGRSTLCALCDSATLSRDDVRVALGELERAGMLCRENDEVCAFGVWSEAAIDSFGGQRMLFDFASLFLEAGRVDPDLAIVGAQ